MKEKTTDQLNLTLPLPLIQRLYSFFLKNKKVYFKSLKEAGALVIEAGLDVCEKEIELKKKKNDK